MYQACEQDGLATLKQEEQIACFLHHDARVAASPFLILFDGR